MDIPGVEVRRVERCGSTNSVLLAEREPAAPVLLVAAEQTAGRGRRGRRWHSAPGAGLTFSLGAAHPPAGARARRAVAGRRRRRGARAARARRRAGRAEVAQRPARRRRQARRHPGRDARRAAARSAGRDRHRHQLRGADRARPPAAPPGRLRWTSSSPFRTKTKSSQSIAAALLERARRVRSRRLRGSCASEWEAHARACRAAAAACGSPTAAR